MYIYTHTHTHTHTHKHTHVYILTFWNLEFLAYSELDEGVIFQISTIVKPMPTARTCTQDGCGVCVCVRQIGIHVCISMWRKA